MRLTKYILLSTLLFVSARGEAQSAADMTGWRIDLKTIGEQLPARHPNAYYRMTRASWDSAVASIDKRLPSMTKNQATVALMQLVAMVNDGHTSINPMFDRALGAHYYPVELYSFEDGLFVKSASSEYASAVGGKVVKFGKVSATDAISAAGTTFGHENDWWVNAWAASRITLAEVADGLGLVADVNNVPLVVERDGKQETVILHPTGKIEPSGHNPMAGVNRTGWIDMGTVGAVPLWLQHQDQLYWSDFVPSDGTLYVSYRANTTVDNFPNQEFWKSVFAKADSLPVRRLVIDIRDNVGGESAYNKQVIRGIIARPQLDRPDRLFVITSGKTFSAAMNLAEDLEQWTNATFVGQPTGNSLVFFGDHRQITLPVSGFTVNISSLPWYPANPTDKRAFIAPRLYTALSSVDYRSNVDPAMRAIISRGTQPRLVDRVEQAISRGDSASALKLLSDAALDPINRFRSPEADINALGYRLMPTNRMAALAVFRLNTQAFPRSANTWDSYGENLLIDRQKDAGIAAYRKALDISPGLVSATEALQRLRLY
ncbi:MAG: hypothetical protein ABJC63_12990 [Gemmatimonadales bacterium]